LLPEDAVQGPDVLDFVVVLEFVAESGVFAAGKRRLTVEKMRAEPVEVGSVQEGIAGGDVILKSQACRRGGEGARCY